MAVSPTVRITVSGARGPRGAASGPLTDGTVDADTISNNTAEQDAITAKLRVYKRERLTADRTYYVRTGGSDSNTGLTNTNGAAFATIQKAVDVVLKSLDLNGYACTIRVADGTYNENVFVGGLPIGATAPQCLKLTGNTASRSAVTINSPNASAALQVSNSAYLLLDSVRTTATSGGFGVIANNASVFEHQNCEFGVVAQDRLLTQSGAVARARGYTDVTGNGGGFCHYIENSLVTFADQTIEFHGDVFSGYAWGGNNARLSLSGTTIIGYMTAAQISVHNGAYMDANLAAGVWTANCFIEMNGGGYISRTTDMYYRTFYVRTDGDDDNDGLADNGGRGFKTINGALTAIAKLPYDPIMFSDAGIIIRVGPGTYAETVQLRSLPYAKASILGNTSTPGSVIINGVQDGVQAIGLTTMWDIGGFKLVGSAGSCLRAAFGSVVTYHDIEFGTATGGYHIDATDGAVVTATGNYSITGSANAHFFARNASGNISDKTVTLTGTPSFSAAFAYVSDMSMLRIAGMTFTGSATGKRYEGRMLSAINTGSAGASYLPGNSDGSVGEGSQYV